MVLRIRLADGSMEKVMVPHGAEETMTLSDLLNPFEIEKDSSIQIGTTTTRSKEVDTSSPLSGLGVKHGSLITVKSATIQKPTESRFKQLKVDHNTTWHPFPDLAKDYEHALLKTKTRRSSQKGMSYGDIARLQSSLHIVEPQQKGPLKRFYMCHKSAERFQANGIVKKAIHARVGLLLGTVQTERVDSKPRKARTSLSSQTSDSDYCTVAKVQAVWEPPGQNKNAAPGSVYDETLAQSLLTKNPRVLAVAEELGLVPIGWMFSHKDNRHQDDEALPVFGLDVKTAAKLQITNMQQRNEIDGRKFATLAMDATTGATEAFQLSDVSVQMVHEEMIITNPGESRRLVPTKHAVLVDGRETKELDSVLCLVNTAMLSHAGAYSGTIASVKKNGSLTNKARKALIAALDDDRKLLEQLCDFNALLALDQSLSKDDSQQLCQLVRKWARGQKQGTQVGSKLKRQLRIVLES